MWLGTTPSRALAPEQTNVVVGIPTAAAPPSIEIMNETRHRVTGIAAVVLDQSVFYLVP